LQCSTLRILDFPSTKSGLISTHLPLTIKKNLPSLPLLPQFQSYLPPAEFWFSFSLQFQILFPSHSTLPGFQRDEKSNQECQRWLCNSGVTWCSAEAENHCCPVVFIQPDLVKRHLKLSPMLFFTGGTVGGRA